MRVWYRHSGDSEVEDFPPSSFSYTTIEDVGEITSRIGDYHITHMCIRGEITLSLSAICQRLTYLMMPLIDTSSQLLE